MTPCGVICVDCTGSKRATYQATIGPASIFQNVADKPVRSAVSRQHY
jgi:hypothetical protein